jgi:DNA polymerase-1
MENTLYIIDGHGLIYRAYYAFIKRPLLTTKGENTSALFGFMRMLLRLIHDEQPDYLICVFDAKGKTFRHELYPEYKAKRLKAPEDLAHQVEAIKTILPALGISILEVEGYEADDLIGSIVEKAVKIPVKSVIVSGDKDILQLVDDRVTVLANKKGISEVEVMNQKKVYDTWGVRPENIIDLLALMGDSSDNVPGVKGVGKKTAQELIQQFGTVDSLFEHMEDVEKEKVRELLEKGREDALLSKRLVMIRKDAPVDVKIENFLFSDFPRNEGIELLIERELNSIASELRGSRISPKKIELQRGTYRLIESKEQLSALKKQIIENGYISLDTETTGRDPTAVELIGVSISVNEGEGFYIPIMSHTGLCLGQGFLHAELKPLLEDAQIKKVGQNIKYDYVVLLQHGVQTKGIIGDTMIAAYLLNPQKQRYSLDDLAAEYLDYSTIRYDEVVTDKKKTLADYPVEQVTEYAGEDSDIALRLVHILEKKLEEEQLFPLYNKIEIPLLVVLGKMESTGVFIDTEYLNRMSTVFSEEIFHIEEKVYSIAGEEFNIRSTKQLSEVLYERLGLPVIKRTKTGRSTDESVLEELARDYEIARLLLRHRTLTKLKSTYVDSLPLMINSRTGKIHTSFNQTIAATGRLSSSNPNLQNIPIREKEGRAIRRAFIPQEGWMFVSADYSQIELRILASLASDETLIDTFMKDGDVHRDTAALLFGVGPDGVDTGQRQAAKTINFSVIYGISPFGLSKRLGVSTKVASQFIDTYFQKYSGVKRYFEKVVEEAKKNGYVQTLLGRRRYIPEIYSENRNIFDSARRIAINTPVQGTAADLIKRAMVDIDRELESRKMRSRMLIQVHDELLLEAPRDEYDELVRIVREKMETAIEFTVPLKVNISVGNNWEEAH